MTATPNAIDELVGKNVRYWRLEREMTVVFVARALGLSAAAYSTMEAGATRISVADLQKVCALLRIRPSSVYDDQGRFLSR